MGWDAHTNAEKDWDKKCLKSKKLNNAFSKADEFVKKKAGSVDCYLFMAGLDCSACAKMLEEATGKSCYDDDWEAKNIEKIYLKSNWNFEYKQEDTWAYWSAKKFLELCSKFKLTVTFSW
jgi:phage FluMu protein Com